MIENGVTSFLNAAFNFSSNNESIYLSIRDNKSDIVKIKILVK